MTKAQEDKLDFLSSAVERIEASNANILELINEVLQVRINLKNYLEKRVREIGAKIESFVSMWAQPSLDCSLANLQNKIGDMENCSRLCNILFLLHS